MRALHVFAGPSRPAAPVATGNREVVWHPPIQHGDLFALAAEPGSDVLIVDGLYQQRAPIRHKEIIWALRQGVHVSGAASLGALRAAELDRFGMRGLGTVYGWYAGGRLDADADVALIHGPADDGYVPLSIAMVSLIAAGDWLRATDRLTRARAGELLALCSEVHFTERSRPALRRAAAAAGLTTEMDTLLAALGDRAAGDVKQRDAAAAIATLAAADPPAATDLGGVPESSYEAQWRLDFAPWRDGTEGDALTFARLFLSDYPRRHRRYVLGVAGAAPGEDATRVAARAGLWPADEAERRDLLGRFCTGPEMREHTANDLALTTIVRSFRLRPGRLVYQRFPAELFGADDLRRLNAACAKALRLNEKAHDTVAAYSATQLAGGVVDATFAALWGCPGDIEHAVLDRGFAGVDHFRRQARPFVVAARAMLRGRKARHG
jgi:hypothetical protein